MASFQYISSTTNNNNNNNSNSHQQNIIPQDLIMPTRASVEPNIIDFASSSIVGKGRSRRKLSALNYLDYEDADIKKKMMHREIEKQRRKGMAALHSLLRSLIPLEFIKGKRSVSDHMNGAVNYIKHLQMRITELSARRDDLKSSNLRALGSVSGSSSDHRATSTCVMVHACAASVEIVLSCGSSNNIMGHGLPLSRVLQLLLGQGLTLVSCVTTKVSDVQLLHTIQAEVTGPESINLSELQQNLNITISSWNKSP